jgi:MFS family permease
VPSVARSPALSVVQAVSVTIAGVLPAFLVGALAVQIREDLSISLGGIGAATATFFTVSGLLARSGGRVVQAVGSRRGLTLAASLSTAALVVAGSAPAYAVLVVAMVIGGCGNAVAQPAANLSLSELVRDGRLGLAFGLKQASIPAATLLGGLSVPLVALVFGWRWALALGALLALSVAGWAWLAGKDLRTRVDERSDASDRGLPRAGLLVLTVAAGLGAAASTSLGVFLVDSGVAAGLDPGRSGLLFAASSLLGLLARVGFGWLADRHPTRSIYVLIANLLTAGALGYALLSIGERGPFLAGSLLAYGAGWAWTGLFHFAIVKENRRGAARVTGAVQTGLSLGAAGGPLAFGLLAQTTSYQTAWLVTGALSLTSALIMRLGRRMVRRSRGLPVRTLRRSAPTTPRRRPAAAGPQRKDM